MMANDYLIPFPTESPAAAEAFSDYVALGPKRSLRGLATTYVAIGRYGTAQAALSALGRWSRLYQWQARLTAAIHAQTENLIAKAMEIDSRSFLRTSEIAAERLDACGPIHIDTVLKIRESVRRPQPRTNASVDVNLSVTVTLEDVAERVAAEEGLDTAEVLAEAERFLKAGR